MSKKNKPAKYTETLKGEPALMTVVFQDECDIQNNIAFGGWNWHLEEIEGEAGRWLGQYMADEQTE